MSSTSHAHNTVGIAAVARASAAQQVLGYGWHPVTSPCSDSAFMAITPNKRQPRRLGQRTT